MKTFAIVVLFILVAIMQHFVNWVWRICHNDPSSDNLAGAILVTLTAIGVSIELIELAIHWYIMY